MAAAFKQGDAVEQIVTPIVGNVVKREIIGDDDCYLVEWTDADGETQQRYFKEEEIKSVEV